MTKVELIKKLKKAFPNGYRLDVECKPSNEKKTEYMAWGTLSVKSMDTTKDGLPVEESFVKAPFHFGKTRESALVDCLTELLILVGVEGVE